MTGIKLTDGVIVDPQRGEAYVMSPDGGIVSIGLDRGQEVWRSNKAAKPLLLSDDFLLGQVETAGPGHVLRIASLRTREQGALASESSVSLPPGVDPLIEQRASRAFVVTAQPLDGDAAVSWEYVERTLTGLPPGQAEVLPGEQSPQFTAHAIPGAFESAARDLGIVHRGAVRVSPRDGAVTPMMEPHAAPVPGAVASAVFAPSTDVIRETHVANIPEPQFASADGRHILNSKRVADDPEWSRYLWRVFEAATQKEIGEFFYHSAFAPFTVAGDRIIVMSQPYQLRISNELVDQPLQIRSIDLKTGALIWQRPVRDTAEIGPPPP